MNDFETEFFEWKAKITNNESFARNFFVNFKNLEQQNRLNFQHYDRLQKRVINENEVLKSVLKQQIKMFLPEHYQTPNKMLSLGGEWRAVALALWPDLE